VKVQTFFTGRFRRYFMVRVAEDRLLNLTLGEEDEHEAVAIKREWKEAREKH